MKGKILIVEDSLTIQRVFELAFLRSGHQVTYIDRGKDLESMAHELKPDLVICDVTLPDIDGYEVVSQLKKDPGLSLVPSILLAGSIEPFDEDRFKSSGADGVIFKPFDSQDMLDKVDELLRDRAPEDLEERREEREVTEEGWDFSDVFEDVELGVAGREEISTEEPFISELMGGSDLTDVERVEDYDIGVDELGAETVGEMPEIEDRDGLKTMEDQEEAPSEDFDTFDEIIEDFDMEAKGEVGTEAESIPEIEDEAADIAFEALLDEDITDDDVTEEEALPEEVARIDAEEVTGLEAEAAVTDEDQPIRMDEEDKMMEEIVRDVEDFPISSGYDFSSHGILKRAAAPKSPKKIDGDEYEVEMREVFSSDEFKDELKVLVSGITEKILWEVFPGIMEELKGEIVNVIKEISASVVPDVAGQIIQEEIKRIREEVGYPE